MEPPSNLNLHIFVLLNMLKVGHEVNILVIFEKKYNSFVFIDYHNADVDNLNTHNDPKIPDVPTN
jgi:hypothetical protein|tara:strand:+ start:3698 stop:3892 length:195 start_codon:yes stop_codon:yes gene_type:complete